jgi:hypothetical protein
MGIAPEASSAVNAEPVGNLHARLEQRIFLPLAQLRRRGRLYLVLDAAVFLCLTLLGGGVVQMLLDWGLNLAVDQRGVLSAFITAVWMWMLYRRLLVPLLRTAVAAGDGPYGWTVGRGAGRYRSLSDRALALAVDRAHPELHDQIAAAVQFARGQVGAADANSPQLVRAVMEEACETASDVRFMAVLNHRRARQRVAELAGLMLGTVVAMAVIPDLAGTWFRRNWLLQEVVWPQQTTITPVGFDEHGRRRVPRGDELGIAATNAGRVPKSVELRWWTNSGRKGNEPMTLVGVSRWEASLGVLSEDVTFRIVGGDERTREYVVVAVDRPRVAHTVARITPPGYTGLASLTIEQQTVLELLAGSTLEIEAELNQPVESARFVGMDGEVGDCARVGPKRLRVSWDAPASGSYFFELTDRDGWTNGRPVRYTLKVVDDLPPVVHLELPDVGASIAPTAELPVEASFEDVYGLGGAALLVQRGDDPPIEVALEGFAPGRREFDVETMLAMGMFGVTPGERVRIWAESSDQDPKGPNVGRSEPVDLRVVTPTEFLAELAGRELELRREFERLISAQRGLTDALERLLPELPEEGVPPAPLGQRLTGLARRQDADAKSCLAMCQRFEQMLGEMRINKVARSGDERRIAERIVGPLERLAAGAMPDASAAMADLRHQINRDVVEALPGWQADILGRMRAVLANMLEWEGYREAVALLQEIIDAQTELRAETIEALQRQVEDILGLEEPLETVPDELPKP